MAINFNRKNFNLLLAAARAAKGHLEQCEAGRIVRPFKSRSLPLLRNAISKVEGK